MATFLANGINATDRDVTGPPEQVQLMFPLRRRNTRYKNSQFVAQHCFVASFGRCFAFLTLCDQLVAQQKHLLRVEESCGEK